MEVDSNLVGNIFLKEINNFITLEKKNQVKSSYIEEI